MEKQLDLDKIRQEINGIDDSITELYEKRLALCDQVAQYKKQTGTKILDSSREKAILDRLTSKVAPQNSSAVLGLYERIMQISRARQSSLISEPSEIMSTVSELYKSPEKFPETASVACQGVPGAYSSIACGILFENPQPLYFENFRSVISSVSSGLCQYGILPFENSIYGSVSEVYEMLSRFEGFVVRSIKLPIHHALVTKKGTSLSEITEIFSHSQAIGQCSDFLYKNNKIKVNVCENTAVAAKMVSESERCDIAAICSDVCADKYGLCVLDRDIQNNPQNFTMFYCISKKPEIYHGINKVAAMFNIENKKGALESVLSLFSLYDINLTKIESRPIPGKDFEFMFYAEADTCGITDKIISLFTALENDLPFFKFMGAYKEIIPKN